MKRASGNGRRWAAFVLAEPGLSLGALGRSAPDTETSAVSKQASTRRNWMSRVLRGAKDSRKSNFGFADTLTLMAVPSSVGRVRARVVLFEIRLLFGTCFCTKYPVS